MININVSIKIDEKDISKLVTTSIRRGHNSDNINKPSELIKRLLREELKNRTIELLESK